MTKKTFLADGTVFKDCIGSMRKYFRYDRAGVLRSGHLSKQKNVP